MKTKSFSAKIRMLACAALAFAAGARAQTDRIQASVSLATINDILEKFRATKGLDQSGYMNLGNVLPVNYSVSFSKISLGLDPANNRAIVTADLNLASDFDFPLWNYKYSQNYRIVVDGNLQIAKAASGQSAASIQLCPSPTSTLTTPPVIMCLASGSPVSCTLDVSITDFINKTIANTKCIDVTGLGKALPAIDMSVVSASQPIVIYPDKIGFGYTVKPYKIPINMAPILSLLLD